MSEQVVLTVGELVGNSIRVVTTPPAQPSPYFTYDSNRYITGLVQGPPNILDSGTYFDYNDWEYAEEHDGEYEKPYSGWVLGSPNKEVNDPYALGVGNEAFYNTSYVFGAVYPDYQIGSVNLPNVTYIGDSAFSSQRISTLTLPKVTSLGSRPFEYASIGTLSLPLLESLHEYNLFDADVGELFLPKVTSIDTDAFYSGCLNMTALHLDSMTTD